MRRLVGTAVLCCLIAGGAAAETDGDKAARCANSAAVVMEAVQARKDGVSQRKTQRELVKKLDRTAGEMLAEWIWSLPEDQLTDEVGKLWETQCLAQ